MIRSKKICSYVIMSKKTKFTPKTKLLTPNYLVFAL